MRFKTDKKLLFKLSEDIVDVYSTLFTKGNKKKALKELDDHPTITLENAVVLAFFSGGSTVQIAMFMSIAFFILRRAEYVNYFIEELYSFDSLYRILFLLAYTTFASGLLITIWKRHEINYIHIMQIEFKDRMN